jgi:hypothetical protein
MITLNRTSPRTKTSYRFKIKPDYKEISKDVQMKYFRFKKNFLFSKAQFNKTLAWNTLSADNEITPPPPFFFLPSLKSS